MASVAANLVRRNVDAYLGELETWKRDHSKALNCFDFEDLLAYAVEVYQQIIKADERLRKRVLCQEQPHDADADRTIEEAIEQWAEPAAEMLNQLAAFEKQFGAVKHAASFRAACEEVEGILTPDDQFFDHEQLRSLRDEAIDEHRRGETCEFGGA